MLTKLIAAGAAAVSILAVGVYLASSPGDCPIFGRSPSTTADYPCCAVAKRSCCLNVTMSGHGECAFVPDSEPVASMVGGVAFAVGGE